MRNAWIAIPTLAATLSLLPSRAPGQDLCAPAVELGDTAVSDVFHPSYFVQVDEVPGEGDTLRHVFTPRSRDVPRRRVIPVMEVDRNSTLRITFARAWMARQPDFEARVRIDGSLNDKPIEVPAYSVVGKEAGSGVASVRAAQDLRGLVCPAHSAVDQVSRELGILQRQIDRAEEEAKQDLNARPVLLALEQATAARSQLTARLAGVAEAERGAAVDSIRELDLRIEQYHADPRYQRVVRRYAPTAIPSLQAALVRFNSTLDLLSRDGNAELLALVARRTRRDGRQLGEIAGRLRASRLDTLAAAPTGDVPPAAYRRRHDTIEEVRRGLEEISSALTEYRAFLNANHLRSDPGLLRDLKDTEVVLSGMDVKPGDRLTLSFTNAVDTTGNRRLDVPMRITRFGWVREINDSFLFLRRRHANYTRTPASVTQAAAAVKPGETREIDVPVGINYALVPGASLTWSYRDRSRRSAWRWIQPSGGLQVAFPKFETRTYTISRTPDGAAPSVRDETRGNAFDIALGGIVTLFDNAVGVSVGRDLMTSDRPYYTAFSVSFVSLAKRAATVLPTSQ